MAVKRKQKKSPADDEMIWIHLGKILNLSERAINVRDEIKHSVNRIVAILNEEQCQEDEPESVAKLRRVAEMLKEQTELT